MGGGGGGSGPSSLGDTSKLEAKVKSELKRDDQVRRNIFISFSYDDIDEVNLLRGQAKNEKSDIEFIDRSVRTPFDSERAEYLRQKIAERINQASMTLIYLSDNSAKSDWVDWEIRKSIELGRDVIAVHKGDTPPKQYPDAVAENKIEIISWSRLSEKL